MNMENFKIASKGENGKLSFQSVEGERITIEGVNCFWDKRTMDATGCSTYVIWIISQLETGIAIAWGLELEDVKNRASDKIKANKAYFTDYERMSKTLEGFYPMNK